VSAVDSGNLAGHLLTLRAGLLALADDRILAARLFDGLSDTLAILADAARGVAVRPLAEFRKDLASASASPPGKLALAHSHLVRMAIDAGELATNVTSSRNAADPPESDASEWAEALLRQCHEARDELTFLAPWLLLPAAPAGLSADLATLAEHSEIPTLRTLAKGDVELAARIERDLEAASTPAQRYWLSELQRTITQGCLRARERMATIQRLAVQSGELGHMEFGFLYDHARQLFTIGYNVAEQRADASYYDLLASEARLSTFVAIAQGEIPQESWFALGRLLTRTAGEPVLLSWSGSMFEYLMPLLVMPTYDDTCSTRPAGPRWRRQIEYGRQRGVPWGISESGYNTVDVHLNYQYRAFGVPGLGLKRGLADDLVIAPYASALALMVAPEEACANLQRLAAAGFMGSFGLFEAIDYTPARQRRGQDRVVVRSFMAHHQGMSAARARLPSAGAPDAAPIRIRSRVPVDHAAAAGTHSASATELVFAHRPARRDALDGGC
jgi:cyclic beta-1,2-glucan synthetase